MTAPTCSCGRPVADNARLCSRKPTSLSDLGGCTERLARDLGDIGALAEELQTTRLRQSRTGGKGPGVLARSQDRPVPWDERASETAEILRLTTLGWVRVVLEERGGRLPAANMGALGGFLLANLEWLRHHPAADECADEVGHAVQLARQAVDSAVERTYAGPCREEVDAHDDQGPSCCLAELHVRVGARTAVCPRCAAEHDVADRKAWLLAVAENQLVTLVELERLLRLVGRPVPRGTLDSWVQRKRLVSHGGGEPPRYFVRDAIDLVVVRETARAARDAPSPQCA